MNVAKYITTLVRKNRVAQMNTAYLEFINLAREIRTTLASQSPLLDQYLSTLFAAANLVIEDKSTAFQLQYMCKEKVENFSVAVHPFFGEARKYMDENPLDLPSPDLKASLYCTMLMPNYIQKSAETNDRHLHDNLDSVLGGLQELYDQICRKLHGRRKMDKLNLLFGERFLSVTAEDVLLHTTTAHLLHNLTTYDTLDGKQKQTFQILLENDQ